MINETAYKQIMEATNGISATLVAVSKTKTVNDILELYQLGHRDFGENYVQELNEKRQQLPPDIRWHFIGHLQSNKVKILAPFVHLIHGVDSLKLLVEINKQAARHGRNLDVLLQVHIAQEETKFGMNEEEILESIHYLRQLPSSIEPHARVRGMMGMASFTDDLSQVRREFQFLKSVFNRYQDTASDNCRMEILSMGMSSDYQVAIEEGSNMIRIGSLIFGPREQSQSI